MSIKGRHIQEKRMKGRRNASLGLSVLMHMHPLAVPSNKPVSGAFVMQSGATAPNTH